jgi:hypothetical protein
MNNNCYFNGQGNLVSVRRFSCDTPAYLIPGVIAKRRIELKPEDDTYCVGAFDGKPFRYDCLVFENIEDGEAYATYASFNRVEPDNPDCHTFEVVVRHSHNPYIKPVTIKE